MSNKHNGLLGQIVVPVVLALLVGGVVPWWWQELIVKNNNQPSPTPSPSTPSPSTPSPSTPSPSTPSPPTPPTSPPKTSINIAYQGDYLGCSLPITINIGNQKIIPNSNQFEVNNIEEGEQKYRISGNIYCPVAGQCQVYGEGFINVVAGKIYYIAWQNTRFAQCDAILQ